VNIDDVAPGQRVVWTDPDGKRHLGTVRELDMDSAYAISTKRHVAVVFDSPRFDGDEPGAPRCDAVDLDAIPPEPPDGAVVMTPSGQAWQRHDGHPSSHGRPWWGAGEYDYSNETWETLILSVGLPIRVIVPVFGLLME